MAQGCRLRLNIYGAGIDMGGDKNGSVLLAKKPRWLIFVKVNARKSSSLPKCNIAHLKNKSSGKCT